MLRPSLLAFALLVPVARLCADVLVVDPAGGGGSYAQIQAAVDAALDGDVILVKSGSYAGFLVNQKSLAILGDTGASVSIGGGVRVRSLPADGMVLLANLSATGIADSGNSSFGLWCSDNQGCVRVEHCSFTGASSASAATNGWDGWPGARVALSPRVSFVDTSFLGGRGRPDWDPTQGTSGAGLEVESSSVSASDCVLLGGDGQDNAYLRPDAAHGGDGCTAVASTLYFSGCALQGGHGGYGTSIYFVLFALGGNGGDGLDLTGSLARIQDTTTLGGAPGTGWPPGVGADGIPGLARRGAAAQFLDLAEPARRALLTTPAREGTQARLQVSGLPGDHVYLVLDAAPDFVLALDGVGMRLTQNVYRSRWPALYLGDVPAGGLLDARLTLPKLPPSAQARALFVQLLLESAAGPRVYGSSGTLVLLDSGF